MRNPEPVKELRCVLKIKDLQLRRFVAEVTALEEIND